MSPQQLEPGKVLATISHRIRVLAREGRPVVVAIDGPSGSGKTTLADDLAAAVAGRLPAGEVRVFHMDNIYPGWDGLADGAPLLVEWVLKPLRHHSTSDPTPLRWQRYDWIAGRYAEWHHWPVPAVLIVEGVNSAAAVAADYLDLMVWVGAPRLLRFRRGIERDGDAYAPHWRRWQRQEDAVFARNRTAERSHLHVDGTKPW